MANVSTAKLIEGKSVLLVPRFSLNSKVPPRSPAFFNPFAKISRDISMLLYEVATKEASKSANMADALAGTGARGVRVAVEVPGIDEVCINDLNPSAIKYAKATAKINGVLGKCRFSRLDACQFLMSHSSPGERLHIVDIDPFGSPAPYLECAIRAVRRDGWLSLTATDTPVLCGIYPNVAFRRYSGYPLRTEYCHEIGIRLILAALARVVMRMDMGIVPIFSHNTRHYFRTYVRLVHGVSAAEMTRQSLGYVNHCFTCGHRSVEAVAKERCLACGANSKTGGPVWTDNIYDANTLKTLVNASEGLYKRLFERALEELGMPPTYYVPDRISDELQTTSPSLSNLIEALRLEGYRASRSAINPRGVKTDASISIVKNLIRRLSLS